MKKIMKRALALGISAAAIAGGAVAGVAISYAVSETPSQVVVKEANLVKAFSVNENGQSYGLIDEGLYENPEARPQLVFVSTDEGKDGYAYYTELFPNAGVTSVREAEASSTDEPYAVPVYELDGKSFIGFHTVNRT